MARSNAKRIFAGQVYHSMARNAEDAQRINAVIMATGEFTQDEVNATGAYQFTTYGLLARSDDQIVAVASEEGEDGKLRGVTFIPRAMVVEMVEIGRPRARKAKTCVSSATPDSSTS